MRAPRPNPGYTINDGPEGCRSLSCSGLSSPPGRTAVLRALDACQRFDQLLEEWQVLCVHQAWHVLQDERAWYLALDVCEHLPPHLCPHIGPSFVQALRTEGLTREAGAIDVDVASVRWLPHAQALIDQEVPAHRLRDHGAAMLVDVTGEFEACIQADEFCSFAHRFPATAIRAQEDLGGASFQRLVFHSCCS